MSGSLNFGFSQRTTWWIARSNVIKPASNTNSRFESLSSFPGDIAKFARQTPIKEERCDSSGAMKVQMKTPATIAKQMERAMQRAGRDCLLYQNEHCTLFENDLERICPRNDENRRKKLTEFAAQYGFRLRFYCQGLFAIFGKRTPPVAHPSNVSWLTSAS